MHGLSDVIGGFTLGTAYLLIALWVSPLIFVTQPAAGIAEPVEAGPPARDGTAVGRGGWPAAV